MRASWWSMMREISRRVDHDVGGVEIAVAED